MKGEKIMKNKLSRTGRILSVLVGILTTMIASGCASQDAEQRGPATRPVADYTVIVHFDTNGCPTKVTPTSQSSCTPTAEAEPTDEVKLRADGTPLAEIELPADLVCAKRGEAIEWVSNPARTRFEVYFDPFVGRPYKSNPPDHKTRAFIVDQDSKVGKYEYSVLGLDCTGGNPVLDPPIRVED
jgi:hypothetical protein